MRGGEDVYGTGNFHTPQLVTTCRLVRKNELSTLMDKIIGFLYLTYREEISVPGFALSEWLELLE